MKSRSTGHRKQGHRRRSRRKRHSKAHKPATGSPAVADASRPAAPSSKWPKAIVVFAVLATALGVTLLGHDVAVAVDEERALHGDGVRGTFVVHSVFHESKGDQGTYEGPFRAPGHNRPNVYSHAYLLVVGQSYRAVLRSDGYSVYVPGHPDWLGVPLLVPLALCLGIGVPLGVGTVRRIRSADGPASRLLRRMTRS